MFPAYRESLQFVPAVCSAIRTSRPEIDPPGCELLQRPVGGWRLRDNATQSGSIRLRENRLPRLCRVRLFPEVRQRFDLGGYFAPPANPRSPRRVGSYDSACTPTTPPGSLTAEKAFWHARLIPAQCCTRSSSTLRRCARPG